MPALAARVDVMVSIAGQQMTVKVGGKTKHTWTVSTGKKGYPTPRGTYRAKRLEPVWFSTTFNDAPMPNSIFFVGAYAIHGTYATGSLGKPVSHGCIRLAPGNAAKLFGLVKQHGKRKTYIHIN